MLICGTGGHAIEILDVLSYSGQDVDICFFDQDRKGKMFNGFPMISAEQEAVEHFRTDNRFCLGVGDPFQREKLYHNLKDLGGVAFNVISALSVISNYHVHLGDGLNIMHHAMINSNASVGNGTLINSKAEVHHDAEVGNFCVIGPAAQLLGGVRVGNYCNIGAGAIILPGIKIGNNVVIGAGAVVTKNVDDFARLKGVPAR